VVPMHRVRYRQFREVLGWVLGTAMIIAVRS
jgi:hypothetical protein